MPYGILFCSVGMQLLLLWVEQKGGAAHGNINHASLTLIKPIMASNCSFFSV